MKNRLRSWFTTILGMVVASMFVMLRFLGEVSDLSMWLGIAVGVILLFFKEQWAQKMFEALKNKL